MHKRVNAKVVENFIDEIVTGLMINETQAHSLVDEAHRIYQNKSYELMREGESSGISSQLESLAQRLAKLPQDVPAVANPFKSFYVCGGS